MEKQALARAVAASINQIVPSGFRCFADADMITVQQDDQLETTTLFGDIVEGGPDYSAQLVRAARAVLNSVQDYVIEAFHGDSWPQDVAGKLPEAHASVSGHTLEMWFGDSTAPVLKLPAVKLQAR